MIITLKKCIEISPGLWKAHLDNPDFDLLGKTEHEEGARSVVLLSQKPEFTEEQHALTFTPGAARLVNRGSTSEVVFVALTLAAQGSPTRSLNGDAEFLGKLPSYLYHLGFQLLCQIRSEFRGELRYRPTSKKFVESPDNFFTLRIQPRDSSLRITVRGLPGRFKETGAISLKRDRTSYSAFKISKIQELDDVMRILRQADRKAGPSDR